MLQAMFRHQFARGPASGTRIRIIDFRGKYIARTLLGHCRPNQLLISIARASMMILRWREVSRGPTTSPELEDRSFLVRSVANDLGLCISKHIEIFTIESSIVKLL